MVAGMVCSSFQNLLRTSSGLPDIVIQESQPPERGENSSLAGHGDPAHRWSSCLSFDSFEGMYGDSAECGEDRRREEQRRVVAAISAGEDGHG